VLFETPGDDLEPAATLALDFTAAERKRASQVEPTQIIIGRARRRPLALPDGGMFKPGERYDVLQLACSFVPGRDSHVDWARFRVEIRSEADDVDDPIAVDLSPLEVTQPQELELSINFEPKVAFGAFSASLGSLSTKVQSVRVLPVTIAGGLNANTVYWQMQQTAEHPIAGARAFYALLSIPREEVPITVTCGAVVDIRSEKGTFRAATHEHRNVPGLVQHL